MKVTSLGVEHSFGVTGELRNDGQAGRARGGARWQVLTLGKERPHPEPLALSGPESKSRLGSFRQCKCFPRKFPFLLPDQEGDREQIEFS